MRACILLYLLFFSWFGQVQAAPAPIHDTMNSIDPYTWRISDGWSNGGMFAVGWRADHVDIYANTLRLTLNNKPCVNNVALCSGAAYAAGEYSSQALLPAGQVTFRAKVAKASGVITGLFLYTGASDNQPHDEIDIEFLGKDTTQVQFNYFVSGVGGHEALIPLGFDASLTMHDYSITWDATHITWSVDGVVKHEVKNVALPTSTMRIFTNLWAAKTVDAWSGVYVYQQPLYSYVDKVDYVPAASSLPHSVSNASTSTTSGGCVAQVWSWQVVLCLTLWFLGLFQRKAK